MGIPSTGEVTLESPSGDATQMLFEELKNSGMTLLLMGSLHRHLGEYRQALDCLQNVIQRERDGIFKESDRFCKHFAEFEICMLYLSRLDKGALDAPTAVTTILGDGEMPMTRKGIFDRLLAVQKRCSGFDMARRLQFWVRTLCPPLLF